MDLPELKIRRARRQDFAAVLRLLAPGDGSPEPDRRTTRRFRHIVADLGTDLYVAEVDGHVVGVIHATYVRQINGGQRARVEDLAADPQHREQAVEEKLLRFILARARQRDCASLSCVPLTDDVGAVAAGAGLLPRANEYCRTLAGDS